MKRGPQYARYFGPVLEALKELGGSGRPSEIIEIIVRSLKISEEERRVINKNGQTRFENHVHWARFYLAKAGYIDSSARGVWSLTEKGKTVESMSIADANAIFYRFQSQFQSERIPSESEDETPQAGADEQIVLSSKSVGNDTTGYRSRLLSILQSLPPNGFERLCQRLLRESGFEQVVVTGRSGDGGIEGQGLLQVNPFVSFKVLFQCKRYVGLVGAAQVRDFRGAMMGRADKGIIMTTGTFSPDAQKEALRDGVPQIELVNGEKLLDMFENLELGLKPRRTYDIDDQFFEAFQS